MDEQDRADETEPNIPLSPDLASLSAAEVSGETTEVSGETSQAPSVEDTLPMSLPESVDDTPPFSAAPVTPMVPLPYPPAPAPVNPPPPMSVYAPPPNFSQPLNPSQPLSPYAPPPQGYLPPAPGTVPGLPPAPNYYGGYQQPGVPMVLTGRPENPSRTAAIIVEVILDLFGIYGVGWLIAGETTVGIILLVASFVWWPIAVLGTIFTAGLGALCLLPLNIVFLLLSVIMLAQRTSARAPGARAQ